MTHDVEAQDEVRTAETVSSATAWPAAGHLSPPHCPQTQCATAAQLCTGAWQKPQAGQHFPLLDPACIDLGSVQRAQVGASVQALPLHCSEGAMHHFAGHLQLNAWRCLCWVWLLSCLSSCVFDLPSQCGRCGQPPALQSADRQLLLLAQRLCSHFWRTSALCVMATELVEATQHLLVAPALLRLTHPNASSCLRSQVSRSLLSLSVPKKYINAWILH